ncbi:MAG: Trehalose/maltose import ATP-binding protein MalK [Methanomassiliicoccales archaeon PtaU1.Bin124]|nr:MAG: Trehalose/maltose import ATP-binding protein MalK [Methanomassiliicoccales archaeon PtaU1.Bin124]
MIETIGLGRNFDGLVAVDDLNLTVKNGEVFGFLGPNGAGKTTTVRMLCALIAPSRGRAFMNGIDVADRSQQIKIRQMVGLLPESPGHYETLSAYQNLDFYAHMHGVPEPQRKQRIDRLLERLDLKDRKDDRIATYSKGMKQKVAIARALVHDPEYVFLDEPTSGLDPVAALTVREFISELKKDGRTIFLNTHHLEDAEKLCDRIGVMSTRMLALGHPQELADSFFGRGTVVELDMPRPDLLAEVQAMRGVVAVRMEDAKFIITVDDPVLRNPAIVADLVRLGAKIRYIEPQKRSLEDVYLKVVGR